MAKGRMINKKIAISERVNALSDEAALLFTWLIPFLDRNGRFSGNISVIKGSIMPLRSIQPNKIEKCIRSIEGQVSPKKPPLLIRYEVGGKQVLEVPGFIEEQIGLRWNKERDEYPAPPPDICRKMCGQWSDNCRIKVGNSAVEKNRTEMKRTEQQSIVRQNDGVGGGFIFDLFNKVIGDIKPSYYEEMYYYQNKCPQEWIQKAFDLTIEAKPKHPWKYITTILDTWLEKGEMTIQINGNGSHSEKPIEYRKIG